MIAIGAIIFYLPFLSFQFIGDDWLWLANAKKALANPSIFIERPMYGYFRPLNMVIVALWEYIFGPNARIFSFINILLHAVNVFLLWLVLKKYDVPKSIRLLSPFIFAFYYLNFAAIEWISVGHDLWVTGLLLIFLMRLKTFVERTGYKDFILMFLVGWAAALFKESGLIAIGLYFAYLILSKQNPFGKKFVLFSTIYLISYVVFLVFYFMTRTIADKQIVIGLPVIVNLWYFLIYLLLPLSKRIVEQMPERILPGLVYIKNALMIIVPMLLGYVFIKGSRIVKMFVIWPVFFIITIAVFKWGITLFTIYTNDPASRFMYSPFAGLAVCIAWFMVKLVNDILKIKLHITLLIVLALLFIAANFVAVRKSSTIYGKQQQLSQRIIDDIQRNWSVFDKADSVTIYTEDISQTEQVIASGEHLPAIFLVVYNRPIKCKIYEMNSTLRNDNVINYKNVILKWDVTKNYLVIDNTGKSY